MIIIVVAALIGVVVGAGLLYAAMPRMSRHHIDYKERWQAAVNLLGDVEITYEAAKKAGLPVVSPDLEISPSASVTSSRGTLGGTLHSMTTWDRAELEIQRAKAGLPAMDDLDGMASWDVKSVMSARMKYGTA